MRFGSGRSAPALVAVFAAALFGLTGCPGDDGNGDSGSVTELEPGSGSGSGSGSSPGTGSGSDG